MDRCKTDMRSRRMLLTLSNMALLIAMQAAYITATCNAMSLLHSSAYCQLPHAER
jgi:hypothetical protein